MQNKEKRLDRRVVRTKKALRESLTKLLMEKPLNSITVREISDLANVNRGTFYIHYKDIKDMFETVKRDFFNEFNRIFDEKPEGVIQENPRIIIHEILEFIKENSDICLAFFGTYGDNEFIEAFKSNVKERCVNQWMKYFIFDANYDFEYVFEYSLSGFVGLVYHWINTGCKEDVKDVTNIAFTIAGRGIRHYEK